MITNEYLFEISSKMTLYQNNKFSFIQPLSYSMGDCACFDLDGCLISKANGDVPYRIESHDSDNYIFLYGVESKINELINNNIQVVIITNQTRLTNAKREMMIKIWNHFNGKLLILIAHSDNEFKKPNPTFLEILKQDYNILYYCGDAIGEQSSFPPFRWGNTDLQFAINAGVLFRDPIDVFGSNINTIVPREQLVIMMGNMGSNKSTLSKRLANENGFIHKEQDVEGNLAAKFRTNNIFDEIFNGKQVIVDACHGSHKARNYWVDEANRRGVSWVILWMARDGREFNKIRERVSADSHYRGYTTHFEKPTSGYIIVS
jgi:DNA 3'-phosphatase